MTTGKQSLRRTGMTVGVPMLVSFLPRRVTPFCIIGNGLNRNLAQAIGNVCETHS